MKDSISFCEALSIKVRLALLETQFWALAAEYLRCYCNEEGYQNMWLIPVEYSNPVK